MATFTRSLRADMSLPEVLQVLCSVPEYDELPVRHNEDKINASMARGVRLPVDSRTADDPHTKANLLLQAHMSRQALPISDYVTDTKSVLDNSLRVLQAMVDVAADAGWLGTALSTINLVQCIMQGRWVDDSSLLILPHLDADAATELAAATGCSSLPELMEELQGPAGAGGSGGRQERRTAVVDALAGLLGSSRAREVMQVVERLPRVAVRVQSARLVNPSRAGPETELDDEGSPTLQQGAGGQEGSSWEVE
eukprot:CAMPEP_0202910650 /NCGR_PEP_ID=MMETSP1392-20130828/52608_1 /ASSEMBLY_ACC=CAM_ASM_000868 /TAXON_ID=225041 /ORGANISM="Chlamydomonas chlamydogama, Strain SAG 11-48b" /LENGTH=252 /DNA_ID=CAMNT_0049600813 /DNA_START=52 /DNA_END=807 /DNA_ORIENTATION=+